MSAVNRRNALALTGAGISAVLANVTAASAMTPAIVRSRTVVEAARTYIAALDHVAELDAQLEAAGVTTWEPWRATSGSQMDRWFMNSEKLDNSHQARAFFTKRRAKLADEFSPSRDPGWGDYWVKQRQRWLASLEAYEVEAMAYLHDKERIYREARERVGYEAAEDASSTAGDAYEEAFAAFLAEPCLTLQDAQAKASAMLELKRLRVVAWSEMVDAEMTALFASMCRRAS